MKYYKANKNFIDSMVIYGDLPENFTIGYESDTQAYFELFDSIDISQYNVTEINKDEYDSFVQNLSEQERIKREQEQQSFLDELEAKKQEEITKQLSIENKISLIQNQANIDISLAEKEMIIKQRIESGEINSTTFDNLPNEEQEIVKLVLFKEFSPTQIDVPKALSAIEFALVGLFKLLGKSIDRTKLTVEEQAYFDYIVSVFSLNDLPIDNTTDWRTQYFHQQFAETQNNRQAYYDKKINVTGTW